jgi:membrane protein DedA with SNARE-associated domain/rhodanese-related sulfurtransferase
MATPSQLTYIGVVLAVLANQLCLPVPAIVFLMAGGALSARGDMRGSVIVAVSVLPCLAADGLWFWFGRKWGSQAMRLLCRFSHDPRTCSRNAHDKFRRHGLPLLCVAKFLPGLDGLMPPLAGAEGVSVTKFVVLDSVGSLLWCSFYVGLGFCFSDQLEVAIVWAKQFGTVIALAIGVPLGLYASWRGLTLVRMIRRLQVRRISPPMLDRKLRSNSKVAVLDLSDFEEETGNEQPAAIPGAFRVDPSRLRKSPRITVPDDVEIVLYCSSQRDVVSARVAVGLEGIGIKDVWVLEGGLRAWRDHGFSVSHSLEPPKTVAQRLGITLPEV